MSSVSVVIPCYNYGHFLEQAVSSVLDDQPGVDVRVLIIDDASPDGSVEVARQIAARDPRVEVLAHRENKGNIATFNEGLLEWADGDYCFLLSADDLATPGALSRACDLMDAHPQVGFVYGRALWVQSGAPLPAPRTTVRGWSVWPGGWWLDRRFGDGENPISTPTVVARTALQQRVGGYDPLLPKAADMEMFMRYAAHADVGYLRGVDQAYYRIHGQNMHQEVSPLMDLQQRKSVFEVALERYGDRLPDEVLAAESVREQLARQALWGAGRVHRPGTLRRSRVGRRLLGAGAGAETPDVEGLIEFAAYCWPEVKRIPLYRTIEAGGRLGGRDLAFMVGEKGRWWLRRRAWTYRGY